MFTDIPDRIYIRRQRIIRVQNYGHEKSLSQLCLSINHPMYLVCEPGNLMLLRNKTQNPLCKGTPNIQEIHVQQGPSGLNPFPKCNSICFLGSKKNSLADPIRPKITCFSFIPYKNVSLSKRMDQKIGFRNLNNG